MAEGSLIRMLKNQYGWVQTDAGTLVRMRRA
jgi:hypothetical protein